MAKTSQTPKYLQIQRQTNSLFILYIIAIGIYNNIMSIDRSTSSVTRTLFSLVTNDVCVKTTADGTCRIMDTRSVYVSILKFLISAFQKLDLFRKVGKIHES